MRFSAAFERLTVGDPATAFIIPHLPLIRVHSWLIIPLLKLSMQILQSSTVSFYIPNVSISTDSPFACQG